MKTLIMILLGILTVAAPAVRAQWVVSAPAVEARQDQKNIFDTLKYAWEQAQWAEKLATLHNTLTTVQQHLETANQVKQAIGDPVAAIGLIDSGLFSDYLTDSGVGDTLGDLVDIAQQGAELSSTIGQLFQPIDIRGWTNFSGDAVRTFDGISSFRDPSDPLRQFRAVQNAYSRFEALMGRAQNKRRLLNQQIARLNTQLKGAGDDAEVQKLAGSLAAAQSALDDLDYISESAGRQVQMLHVLNQNRAMEEQVAAEEISRELNRQSVQSAIEAEMALPDLTLPNPDLPIGF